MSVHPLGTFGDLALTAVVTSPPWYENCYLVHHLPSNTMIVVDPGGDADIIQETIAKSGAAVQAIWLTHGHPDHLGAAHALETAFSIPTLAHVDETTTIAQSSDLSRSFTGEAQKGPASLETFEGEPQLALADQSVQVIATPGHTAGGVVYLFKGFALTGDTLFRQGVGRTDLPGGDEAKLWNSITHFLCRIPDGTMLFSGHGPGWIVEDARRWWKMMA